MSCKKKIVALKRKKNGKNKLKSESADFDLRDLTYFFDTALLSTSSKHQNLS